MGVGGSVTGSGWEMSISACDNPVTASQEASRKFRDSVKCESEVKQGRQTAERQREWGGVREVGSVKCF